MACRPYAIDKNPYEPLTRQEARGLEAPFKLRVLQRTRRKGETTGGNYVCREETVILSILVTEPYPRPPIAL